MIVNTQNVTRIIWQKSRGVILYHFLLATIIFVIDSYSTRIEFNLPIGVLSTMGIAISFFLGFLIRATYDRWWEARTIWGGIVNDSRSFGRQVITLTESDTEIKRELIYRHIAWLYSLTHHLRKQDVFTGTENYIKQKEKSQLESVNNVPVQLIKNQAISLQKEYNGGKITNYNLIQLDNSLNEFYNLQGKCERIKNTVFPMEYSTLSRFFVLAFTTLLPFHLIDTIGFGVIPISIFEGFLFYVLERLSHFYKNPFEGHIQDTPMLGLSRTIEIDLLQMLEEDANIVPKPLQAVEGVMM